MTDIIDYVIAAMGRGQTIIHSETVNRLTARAVELRDENARLRARIAELEADAPFDAACKRIEALEGELAQFEALADLAEQTVTTYEDWAGHASTLQAFRDAMWRLGRALAQAGHTTYRDDNLDWRGSLLHELNEAGFYPSTDDPYHADRPEMVYDPAAPEGRRVFGNAVGQTLKEIVAELAALRAAEAWDIEHQADIEHEIWSSWMRYMFSRGTTNADGTWTMPAWAVERWTRQMNTVYIELSEQEKESDREQARKHTAIEIDRSEGTRPLPAPPEVKP